MDALKKVTIGNGASDSDLGSELAFPGGSTSKRALRAFPAPGERWRGLPLALAALVAATAALLFAPRPAAADIAPDPLPSPWLDSRTLLMGMVVALILAGLMTVAIRASVRRRETSRDA